MQACGIKPIAKLVTNRETGFTLNKKIADRHERQDIDSLYLQNRRPNGRILKDASRGL